MPGLATAWMIDHQDVWHWLYLQGAIQMLCQVQLQPGWLTIFGQVNRHGTEPATQVYSAWAIPSRVCEMSNQQKPGSNQARCVIQQLVPWSCNVGWW